MIAPLPPPVKTNSHSSICTVFAESEVISLVAEGVERANIVAGLHAAIARRVGAMGNRVGLVPEVGLAGGVAKNAGVKAALERVIGAPLLVPPEPQIVGGLGTALFARDGSD
jgi:activator of 2-hydroxyglutaryl-CoA dehydratase